MRGKLIFILVFLLTACIPSHVADSISDMRWEAVPDKPTQIAPLLDCDRVDTCHRLKLYPAQTKLIESKEEVYVWSYKYWDFGNQTVLYIVVDRGDSWDMLALENIDGEWKVGVYGKPYYTMVGKTPVLHYTFFQDFAGIETGQTIAIGMANEYWAVIVQPIDKENFRFSVDEFHW